MTRQGRPSQELGGSLEHRTIISQIFRLLVDPWLDQLYYWLDLRRAPGPGAPKGYPDHNKVLSSVAFFFGLVGLAIFGREVVDTCAAVQRLVSVVSKGATPIDAGALTALVKACALMTASLLAYAALVFGMAFGLSGFRTWAKSKAASSHADALGRAAEAAAAPEIAARRELGGDYEAT